jgi:hypothetical protein
MKPGKSLGNVTPKVGGDKVSPIWHGWTDMVLYYQARMGVDKMGVKRLAEQLEQ